MSYSPDHDVHDPPIDDLEGYREHLRWQVSRIEAGEMYRFEERSLFDAFEDLLEHCEFLDAELKIEKHEYSQLVKQKEALEKEIEALKEEKKAQKRKLEETAATAAVEQPITKEETGVGANLDDVKPGNIAAPSELEKSGGSLETARVANARKRGASVNPITDGNVAKKGRENGES